MTHRKMSLKNYLSCSALLMVQVQSASGAYYIVINLNERAGKMLSLHFVL